VQQVTAQYLALAEARLPGLVEGLYLHGSLGFGEWYEGRSDIDFVAVTGARLEPDSVAVLRALHDQVGQTFPRPAYSGLYVTWEDLAGPPERTPDVPCVLEGAWYDAGRADLCIVTWHELAHHGVRVHGPALTDVDVWTDDGALRRYSHRNLTEYWAPQVRRLADGAGAASSPDLVDWFVLGIPRLHHAIATGRLTSKDGAGHYALEVFGKERWRPVVAEALTHRAFGEPTGAWVGREGELAAEVLAFCRMALDAGLALDPAG
jgi:hypothetical protein